MGVDLLDWHRGNISTRRLALLVAELPADSRVVTEYRRRAQGHDGPMWDQKEYILADIYDVVQHHRWLFEASLGGKPEYPKPYPRPGAAAAEQEQLKFATTAELTEFFGSA